MMKYQIKHYLRQRRTWLLGAIALVVLLCQYALWVSHTGIPGLIKLRVQVAQIKGNNAQNEQRNHVLYQQIQSLRHSNSAIEAVARSRLGLIQQGEIFYHVVDNTQSPPEKTVDSLASKQSVAKLDDSKEATPVITDKD